MTTAPAAEPRARVTAVDFEASTGGFAGPRFPAWQAAVDHARGSIKRFEYRGQVIRRDLPDFHPRRHFQEDDTLVVYSRVFVQMRVTEPVQDRPGGRPSGLDWVAAEWEVFRDGTVERFHDVQNRGQEPAYTRQQVAAAVNDGADLVAGSVIVTGGRDLDLINLVVNAAMTRLADPAADLDAVTAACYEPTPGTVVAFAAAVGVLTGVRPVVGWRGPMHPDAPRTAAAENTP